MSDRESLYRGVCASPEDDVPRLVFADWLEENGEPERAEFIRLQIERARRADWVVPLEHVAGLDGVTDWGLWRREDELLERYGKNWAGEAVGWSVIAEFGRGFVDAIRLDGWSLFANLEPAVAALRATTARTLVLSNCRLDGPIGREVIASGLFGRVRRLEVTGTVATTDFRERLFRPEVLPSICRLTIGGPVTVLGDGDAGLSHLMSSPVVLGLERLALPDAGLDDEHMRFLDVSAMANVVELDLTNNRVSREGVAVLANSPHLKSLRVLRLLGNPLDGWEVVEILARAGILARLTALDLTVADQLEAAAVRRQIAGVASAIRHLDVGYREHVHSEVVTGEEVERVGDRLARWASWLLALFMVMAATPFALGVLHWVFRR